VAEKVELEVTIGQDGVVRIKTHGLRGQACMVETKGLEEAVGSVKSREKTSEFYQQETQARTGVKNR
jgi:Protein of unknown function (DUF2997)